VGNIVVISGSGFPANTTVAICLVGGPAAAFAAGGPVEALQARNAANPPLPNQASAAQACVEAGGTVLGFTTTDANGNYRFEWDTTGFPPGDYQIVVTDGTETTPATDAVLTPRQPAPGPAPDGGGGRLPQTGGINGLPLRAGVLLMAVGALLLLTTRRQRTVAVRVPGGPAN
jgi:LPXTG-motif cell wall-anchored protein